MAPSLWMAEVDEGEWSASQHGYFTSRERLPPPSSGMLWIRRVRAGEKENSFISAMN
jgi:hypothetical protein